MVSLSPRSRPHRNTCFSNCLNVVGLCIFLTASAMYISISHTQNVTLMERFFSDEEVNAIEMSNYVKNDAELTIKLRGGSTLDVELKEAPNQKVESVHEENVASEESKDTNNEVIEIESAIEESKDESIETKKDTSSHAVLEKNTDGIIKSINILGERNTGTTWLYEHLGQCFNHTVPVRRRLTRYKHWFQDEHVDNESLIDGTLVIAMFRNPFEWTQAMRKTPHHAPYHMDLEWEEFVTKTWTMDRVGLDLEMTEEEKNSKTFCQEKFQYKDIITCNQRPYPKGYFKKTRYSNHQPFYEMRNDGSGEPYNNILEMRAAKIYNFLETKTYEKVQDLLTVRYEDLLIEGTVKLIVSLEKLTGVKATCEASPPQKRKKRVIDEGMFQYLMEHLDWEAERLAGYYKSGLTEKATS